LHEVVDRGEHGGVGGGRTGAVATGLVMRRTLSQPCSVTRFGGDLHLVLSVIPMMAWGLTRAQQR
jgi:hypothetical protein